MVFADTGIGTDPISLLTAYGPMGLVLALFLWMVISGHLVPGREHDRVVRENEALREQNPVTVRALVESTAALHDAAQVQRDTIIALEVAKRARSR